MHLFLKIPWVIFEEPSDFRINGSWEETTTQGLQSGHFLISCHIISMICSSKLDGMSKIFKIGRDLKDPNSVCLFNLCGNRSRYNVICLKFSVFFLARKWTFISVLFFFFNTPCWDLIEQASISCLKGVKLI